MKTIMAFSLLLLLARGLPLHATLLFHDPFASLSANYSFANDGTPTTSIGGNLEYGSLASTGGSLDFAIFQTNSNDADSLATNGADFQDDVLTLSDVIYLSVLMQVPDLTAFAQDANSAGGSAYAGFATVGNNPNSYGIGLAVDGAGNIAYSADTGSSTAALGGAVAEGQTVFLVARLSVWQDGASFQPPVFEYLLNPDPSAAEPALWNSVPAVGNVNQLTADRAFVVVNAFSTSWNDDNAARFLVDELRVGSTWDEVTPIAIPEPSTLPLLGLALSLWAFSRRR